MQPSPDPVIGGGSDLRGFSYMIDRLADAERRYEELEASLSDPDVVSDGRRLSSVMKEYTHLRPVVEKYREYRGAMRDADEAAEIVSESEDAELRQLASDELRISKARAAQLEGELKLLLIPRDPMDDKNVVVEIRAGAGGDEAALFAGVLYRMYSMYADSKHYRTELVSANETGLGGYREITFTVSGDGAYSRFKYEVGVHRVQRVPDTETAGRIHTSTATVAVLPEVEDVEVEINPADLEIETIKSSGAGGQHINKTESAIRLIHRPSGIVIECQDERSQFKNRDRAMKLLRAKLYDMKLREQNERIASERRSQVGTGDRSERIRTYNYHQGRITDHRIGLTLYSLDSFLNGDLDEMIDALATADAAAKLRSGGTE